MKPAPIFLLADSQVLFATLDDGRSFGARLRDLLPSPDTRSAYIGASNGDDPTFYSIFEAAMDIAALRQRRMIRAAWTDEDQQWLQTTELIVLAGGDVAQGWDVFRDTGLGDAIVERCRAGAVLIGVSAGAVQLGLKGWDERVDEARLIDTFSLVPYLIDVHDEPNDWPRLKAAVRQTGGFCHGLGIPRGGALVYHPDHSLEPLRVPTTEIADANGPLTETLLLPGNRL